LKFQEENCLCWRGDNLAKKKIKKGKRKKAPELNLTYLLISIAIVIMLMWGISLFMLEQAGITLRKQEQTSVTQETTTAFPCEINRECFMVGCKSNTVTECVNTLGMENYYVKCEAWWDVRVETQDFSQCACINGFCKAQ